MNFPKRTYYFLVNEVRLLRRNPFPILCATVFPIIALIFLVLTFSKSVVQDVPIIVVDEDDSALSRELIRKIDATQSLQVIRVVKDKSIADEEFAELNSYLTVTIAKDLERDALQGLSGSVTIEANGIALLYSKTGYRGIASSILDISHDLVRKRFVKAGLGEKESEFRANPIVTDISARTNPYYDYSIYVIPGLILAILQMSAAFSTLWMFRTDVEHSEGRIIPHRGNRTAFFIGRLLPVFAANIITVLFCYIVIYPLADIPVPTCIPELVGLTTLFVFVSMGMGALMSILLKNLVTGLQMCLVTCAPAFVFSGYTYPRSAMPEFVYTVSNIEPITHVLKGFFPMLIYSHPVMQGIPELLIIGGILWGAVILLLYKPGDMLRNAGKKIFDKKAEA